MSYQNLSTIAKILYSYLKKNVSHNSSHLGMHSHMVLFQVASLCKWFVTNMAVKWLLTSVCALVSHQNIALRKTFLTLITLVRFLSRVSAHMLNNIRLVRETFITNSTTIRFLASMSSHMACQISTLSE